METVDKYLVCC